MYRSKRKIPSDQAILINDTINKIEQLFIKENWLVCLDKIDGAKQRSMMHGIGPNPYGRVDRISNVIYVDYREDFLAMFVHQCIHAIYPEMHERDVTILEMTIVENIDRPQTKRILKTIINHTLHEISKHPPLRIEGPVKLIADLFDAGQTWLVGLDQLCGETDLSIVYDLGRNCHGFVDDYRYVLYVDLREDLLSSFIHECLHVIYPKLEESDIVLMEKMTIKKIDSAQAAFLIKLMLDNAI